LTRYNRTLTIPQEENRVFREIVFLTVIRLVMNSANRMIYPFMPAFTRGLGISATSGRLLISARSIAGGGSFLFGSASDRFGRKNIMLVSLGIFTISLLIVPIIPIFGVVLIVFIQLGLARAIFDPTLQAFVGDSVPFNKRGLAIGIVETAWSSSLLISIPIIGIMIERFGWKSPFYALATLSLIGLVLVAYRIPRTTGHQGKTDRFTIAQTLKFLQRNPVAIQAITFSLIVHVANESIFVVYGEWMEGAFALSVGLLGILTVIIGIAELAGESIVIFFADRLGKKSVTFWGIMMASGLYVIFPLLGNNLGISLLVLFFMFISWEAGIVASITLFSEQLPERRGLMMSSNVTAISIGRVIGALTGGLLWEISGFISIGVFAGLLNIFAAFVLLRNIKNW